MMTPGGVVETAAGWSDLPWAAVSGAVLCVVVLRLRLMFADRGLDAPGHRSLHVRPTPHGGGLGMVSAALLAMGWFGVSAVWWMCVAGLMALSWLDDLFDLPFWLRLACHLAAALVLVRVLAPGLPWWQLGVLVLLVGWVVNAFNFMDGADGLAGSMAACGFAAYAAALGDGGEWALAGVCAAISGAALAFLRFNWHPARIFAGDVGSIPLGFLAGAVGWYGVHAALWPAWFPLLVFAPFLTDASLTLARRMLRGERFWQAHREHCYQRMVLMMGGRHDRMCRVWGASILAGGFAALALRGLWPQWGAAVTLGWILALAGVCGVVERRWRCREAACHGA